MLRGFLRKRAGPADGPIWLQVQQNLGEPSLPQVGDRRRIPVAPATKLRQQPYPRFIQILLQVQQDFVGPLVSRVDGVRRIFVAPATKTRPLPTLCFVPILLQVRQEFGCRFGGVFADGEGGETRVDGLEPNETITTPRTHRELGPGGGSDRGGYCVRTRKKPLIPARAASRERVVPSPTMVWLTVQLGSLRLVLVSST